MNRPLRKGITSPKDSRASGNAKISKTGLINKLSRVRINALITIALKFSKTSLGWTHQS